MPVQNQSQKSVPLRLVRGSFIRGILNGLTVCASIGVAGGLLVTSCGRSGNNSASSTAAEPGKTQHGQPNGPHASSRTPPVLEGEKLLDATRLRRAFSDAPPDYRVFLEETLAVARTGNRLETIEQLQKLLRHPRLTQDQRAAIQESLRQLQGTPR